MLSRHVDDDVMFDENLGMDIMLGEKLDDRYVLCLVTTWQKDIGYAW
jgi:hypothetical protein